jgi:hypothetical protein
MSAFPPGADIAERDHHVRFVPKADIEPLIRSDKSGHRASSANGIISFRSCNPGERVFASSRFSRLIDSTASEQRSSEPSPIDPVVLNEPVRNFHHFDEIDLIAIRSLTRILPDQ